MIGLGPEIAVHRGFLLYNKTNTKEFINIMKNLFKTMNRS